MIGQLTPIVSRFGAAISNCTNSNCDTNFPQVDPSAATLQQGLQLFFALIGTVTVIYIIYAAIRLTLSQGDPQTIAKERQAVVFAILGLIIVVSAELVVTFVLREL